ncbi:MAG: redoxin domain-containing protein [Cyanobacteria bacterium SZAS-4]|nr:redoxin domain-containing protein [Cyanobacteria bacterium SZAS-4]
MKIVSLRGCKHGSIVQSFSFFSSILMLICTGSPVLAEGGATYTPGNDQHLDMQHQIGAKTAGTVDCGRASEADLRALEAGGKIFKPSAEINEIIGTRAPEFAGDLQWINSPPLSMAALRGHPVFIRFWYKNCPMCTSSAPLMNQLYEKYGKDGLVVIGIHTSKTTVGDSVQEVTKAAKELGYKFPIAIDNSWKTIGTFWIHGSARAYSSASFLIDKNGTIVWGHDLGRLELNTVAALSLNNAIHKQLSEK